MNKYELVEPVHINEYIKKGYEFVTTVNCPRVMSTGDYSSGSFMGNATSETISISRHVPYDMFLMRLTPQGETLFGSNK